ncbi:MAG TPA: ABC transporter substrate-binding protein [Stellaceae bacterium]|nr:ABC transporter substrate-binding protein [Stellaceae bacterium]
MNKIVLNIFLAVLIIACGSPAFAATILNEGNSARTSSAELPVDVGVQAGIFAKHGLDVRISYFEGGSKLFQAMTAGSIDIGVSAGPEMALTAKGAPMLAVCNMAPPVSFIGIAVPEGSPIHTVAELKGKRIGVASAYSLTHWLALELARTQGWGPNGVTPISIGNAPSALIAAFRTHMVDAIITSTVFAFDLEAHHQGRLLVTASKFEGNLAAGTIFATNRVIAKDPDAIRRFLAAWFETIDFMRKNKAETVKIESKVTGYPVDVQGKEYDLTIGMFSNECTFDAESLANLKRSFIDLKLLSSPPDMSKLYTKAFMPKR